MTTILISVVMICFFVQIKKGNRILGLRTSGSNQIYIAPPPTPTEILPPKPIVVMP